jgi:hypothetical protein
MGTFEQHPWLLVPIIIITVEFWNVAKAIIKRVAAKRRER